MTTIKFILLFLLLPFFLSAQTFEKVISVADGHMPVDVLELDDAFIVAGMFTNTNPNKLVPTLIALNKKGEETCILPIDRNIVDILTSLYPVNDSLFVVAGYLFPKDTIPLKLVYLLINKQLAIKKQIELETAITNGTIIQNSIFCLNSNMNLVHAFSYFCPKEQNLVGLYLNKISPTLENVKSYHYPRPDSSGYFIVECLAPYKDKDSMLLFLSDNSLIINNNLAVVDTLPHDFKRYYHSEGISGISSPYGAVWLDNKLYIGGSIVDPTIASFDEHLSMTSFYQFESDNEEWTAYETPISTNGKDIYMASTTNYGWYMFGTESPIHILKFNSTPEVVWSKYYKQGDGYYYYPFNTLATKDRGCLILSTRTNNESTTDKFDMYILKVDSLGYYDTTTNVTLNEVINVALYPNPGKEYFTIAGEYNLINSNFTLYNSVGVAVRNRKLNSAETTIYTTDLMQGLYFYTIRKADKILHRGKWIKN